MFRCFHGHVERVGSINGIYVGLWELEAFWFCFCFLGRFPNCHGQLTLIFCFVWIDLETFFIVYFKIKKIKNKKLKKERERVLTKDRRKL